MTQPDDRFRTGQRDAKGRAICGGRNRRGEPCQSYYVMANGRCRLHGGKALKGEAHPGYKHGKYSKYAQSLDLVDRLQDMAGDVERLELTAEIDLARARVAELVGRVQQGVSRDFVKNIRQQWRRMKNAARAKDEKEAGLATAELESLIDSMWADYAAYGDLERWLGRLQGLVESQRKRDIEAGYTLTADQFGMLIGQIRDILTEEILVERLPAPRALLSRLITRFAELEGSGARQDVIEGEYHD